MPSTLSLARQCTGQWCGHNSCFGGRGIASYRISSRLWPPETIGHWSLVRCAYGAYGGCAGPRESLLICPNSEVLRCRLRVDLNALCDLAERLSGLFIMAYRVNSRGGVLHNVTLPRSWFINLILPGTTLGKDTSAFLLFASTTIELMQQIDAQVQRYIAFSEDEEQFIADGNRMTNLTGPLYIARM